MMRFFRLSFLARIAIILIFSLVAIQVLAVMGYFIQRSHNTGTGFRLPLPDQIVAMVELIEKAGPQERATILRAVSSAQVQASLMTDMPAPPSQSWRASRRIERILRRYLSVLEDRRITVLVQWQQSGLLSRIAPFVAPATATIIIALKGGQNLVIQAAGPLIVNVFGFPPGFWAGVIGFCVAIFAVIVIRREVRPLRRLAEAADGLDVNAPRPVIDFPRSAPEIRAVISAFNRMQDRIASLIKARMVMIAGFSHDVRTYATRLRLRAELIGDEAERVRAIRDIEDMISLLDDALFAVQDRAAPEVIELIDIGGLLRDEVDDRHRRGATAAFSEDGGAESVTLLGNPIALRRLFANLIDNAIAYGGEARVSLTSDGRDIGVAIEDAGPGIPAELRESVTQAFVRLEQSRNRKTGGAGLGLAIARKVAEAHGGNLSIGDAEGRRCAHNRDAAGIRSTSRLAIGRKFAKCEWLKHSMPIRTPRPAMRRKHGKLSGSTGEAMITKAVMNRKAGLLLCALALVASTPCAARPAVNQKTPPKTIEATDTERLFLDRLMKAELGGQLYAKNPRSSALGPFQFINSTFYDVVMRHFPELAEGKSYAEIQQLRVDMKVARKAALLYTRENAAFLNDRGVKPEPGFLRLAFLLGPGGAHAVISAKPETLVDGPGQQGGGERQPVHAEHDGGTAHRARQARGGRAEAAAGDGDGEGRGQSPEDQSALQPRPRELPEMAGAGETACGPEDRGEEVAGRMMAQAGQPGRLLRRPASEPGATRF